MNKKQFLAGAESTDIKIDFTVASTTYTNRGGTVMRQFTRVGGELCSVHPESYATFCEDLNDDGTLPASWKISLTGVLNNFKRTVGKKDWEQ